MNYETKAQFPDSSIAPAQDCFSVVPDDASDLPKVTKAIYIGTGGDLVVRTLRADTDVTFRNVPSGYILDIHALAIRASGTTASDIVGLA